MSRAAAADAWRAAVTDWRASLVGRLAAATVATYVRDVQGVAARLGGDPWRVTRAELSEALAPREGRRAARHVFAAVRAFYAWAAESGRVAVSPFTPRRRVRPAPAGWRSALDAWADELRAAGSPEATVTSYVAHVRRLADAFPDREPWDITGSVLSAWVDGRNWSRGTRARALVAWRRFYAWGMSTGQCWRSPVVGLGSRAKPGPAPDDLPDAWVEPVRDHLTWMQAGERAAGTLRVRHWHLHRIAESFPDPWRVSGDDLALWLSEAGVSPEYRRAKLNAARGFYAWAVRSGRTDTDPTAELEAVRVPRAVPRPIPDDALRDSLAAADDRQRLALLLAGLAGLRRVEIAGLRWDDYERRPEGDQLRIRGKGGHVRLVPVHPMLRDELRRERGRRDSGRHGTGWSAQACGSRWIFPGQDPAGPIRPASLAAIVRRALPPAFSLHTLRHRFATAAYLAERDLRAVQELLGHAKPETTARYAAVPDSARAAAVAAVGL